MKWVFTTIMAGVLLIGLFFVFKNDAERVPFSTPKQNDTEVLLVAPQPEEKAIVLIERIALKKSGFLAVRSLENGRLGQIIEISAYLTAEEHANITIELGEFYDGNTDLVVVAYQDTKNDQIFNDLDQLMVNSDNKIIARYVKTGTDVPPEMFANTRESRSHIMGEMKMETVRYTNQGYVPPQLEVSVGNMVQFVNESDSPMWVASNEHPGHTELPTFDQFSASLKATTYTYTFDQTGIWSYHDHLNPTLVGIINVI